MKTMKTLSTLLSNFLTGCCLCVTLCLLLNICQTTDSQEVYGSYKLMDGYKYNGNTYAFQTQPSPSPTPQPLDSQTTTATTTVANTTAKDETIRQDKQLANEDWKQVVPPQPVETTTVSPQVNGVPQPLIAYNRLIPQSVANYNPAMARKIGLSTLLMSGVLYGLTVLPAIIALTTSSASPFTGLFSSLGRRKRSLVNESHIYRQLPLLSNEETYKFLTLFESTLAARKIESPGCKKYYTCKVFYSVLKSGEKPKLPVFENAIIDVFGIAVERKDYKIQFIPTVKMYYNVAKDALRGESCARRYPCSFQASHLQQQQHHHHHQYNSHHYLKPVL